VSSQDLSSAVGEPIIALRTWNLAISRRRVRLVPVGDCRRPWPPRRCASARCGRLHLHHPPDPACSCGLHAAKDIDLLRRTRNPAVIGTVALWGPVIEHELGFRARFGYPQRIRLVCPVCFWQRGLEGRSPVAVAVARGGSATPLCEPHIATAESTAFDALVWAGAQETQSELLSEYAIDLLPAAPLQSVA
jgi:hypothetical protein